MRRQIRREGRAEGRENGGRGWDTIPPLVGMLQHPMNRIRSKIFVKHWQAEDMSFRFVIFPQNANFFAIILMQASPVPSCERKIAQCVESIRNNGQMLVKINASKLVAGSYWA